MKLKKLRKPNETLVNFLSKIILILLMVSVLSLSLVAYIIPHDTIPFLQILFLMYQ